MIKVKKYRREDVLERGTAVELIVPRKWSCEKFYLVRPEQENAVMLVSSDTLDRHYELRMADAVDIRECLGLSYYDCCCVSRDDYSIESALNKISREYTDFFACALLDEATDFFDMVKKAYPKSLLSIEYSSDEIYQGYRPYHYYHGVANNISREGSKYDFRIGVELEVECTNKKSFKNLTEGFASNIVKIERDGSLNDYGVELITIPLRVEDALNKSFWEQIIAIISDCVEHRVSRRCGLHVHVSRAALGSDTRKREDAIGRLLYFYNHFLDETEMNKRIFGRSTGYRAYPCKTSVAEACKILGNKEVFKEERVVKLVDDSLKSLCESMRYFDINIKNRHTIEFRKGAGTIDVDRIVKIISYCISLCEYARQATWIDLSLEDYEEFIKDRAKGANTEIYSVLLEDLKHLKSRTERERL